MAGSKRHIILVHGGGGAVQDMAPFAEKIGDRMVARGFNLLGHGGRAIPEEYDVHDMADELAKNIVKSELTGSVIFGYCFGGTVVLNMISRYPGIVDGAALLAAPYLFEERTISHLEHIASREFIERNPLRVRERLEKHGENWPELLAKNRIMYQKMREKPAVDLDLVSKINFPVLIMAPTADPVVRFEEGRDLSLKIANSKLVTMQGSAHPQEILPYTQIADHLCSFFDCR